MLLSLKKLIGDRLIGRLQGKRDFARICDELAEVPSGETVLLDFSGVSLLTGSWVNAMLVPLYRWVSDDQIDLFPVLINISSDCQDDIHLVAEWNNQCYLHAKGGREKLSKAGLIGTLDPIQTATLIVVLEHGEITGAQLERSQPQDSIKATAWNNRLKELYLKRLLRRRKQGRELFYYPAVKEIVYDG